jgi:uncharacterized membrane protein
MPLLMHLPTADAAMTSSTTIQDTQSARATARAGRFWEIDAMRGVAIITMIVYHTMFDLWYWGVLPNVVLWEGFWKYWQRFTAGTFLVLVGVSMTIVYRRQRSKLGPNANLYPKFFWRGLKIFGLGMGITLGLLVADLLIVDVGFVDFGILHLIGFATMVSYPLLRYKWINLGLWVLFSVIGKWLEPLRWDGTWYIPHFGDWWGSPIFISGRWLAPLGIIPTRYPAIDYFSIFPWLGVVLLGIFLGNMLYTENERRFALPPWGDFFPFNALEFLGRHSLLIYLIHQPLIFLVLVLLGVVRL